MPPLLQGGTSARHGRRIGLSESPDAEHRQRNMAVVRWFTDEAIVGGWNQPTANNEHHAKARRLTRSALVLTALEAYLADAEGNADGSP